MLLRVSAEGKEREVGPTIGSNQLKKKSETCILSFELNVIKIKLKKDFS